MLGITAFVAVRYGLALPAPVEAQQPGAAAVFVEGVSGAAGSELSSDLIAFLPPESGASSFRVTIAFDPALLSFRRAEWAGALPDGAARLDEPGTLVLESRGEPGCQSGSSCRLATVFWDARQVGQTTLRVAGVEAWSGTRALPAFTSSDGIATVVAPSPAAANDSLGFANAAMLIALALLLCGAIAAPFAVAARRRFTRRRQLRPQPATPSADELARFVARYLDDIQAAGLVDEPLPEVDGMARAHASDTP